MIRKSALIGRAAAALLIAVACVMPMVAVAAELTLDQQMQMIRSLSEAQRQATMAANIALAEPTADKFWPLYREYRNEVAKLNDQRVALIRSFADNYSTLTDDAAKKLTNDSLSISKQAVALKTKYIAKYGKVLTPLQAARVLQVENKLDAIVEVEIAKVIPLVMP